MDTQPASNEPVPQPASSWPPAPSNQVDASAQSTFRPLQRYVSPASRAKWAITLLATGVVVDVLVAPVTLFVPGNIGGGGDIWTALIMLVWGLGVLLDIGLMIATCVPFLMWVYRCYRNLYVFGADGLTTSPGFAVAFFFIPILSLYRPYQAIKEIWQASDPKLKLPADMDWKTNRSWPLANWWWFFWIVNGLVMDIAGHAGNASSPTASGFGFLYVAMFAVQAVAALLAIGVVRAITRRQEERGRQIAELENGQVAS
jgi:hypothetical protein